MKFIPLLLFTLIPYTISFSEEEIDQIFKALNQHNSDLAFNLVNLMNHHPKYFQKFKNFDGVIGKGDYGVILKAELNLLDVRPKDNEDIPFLPVALKIFTRFSSDPLAQGVKYMNLTNGEDNVEIAEKKNKAGNLYTVMSTKRYYRKFLEQSDRVNSAIPYVGAVYEVVHFQEVASQYSDVCIYAIQLGEKDLSEGEFTNGNQGQANTDQMVNFVMKITYGLFSLHQAGYFHGDLKLENIMKTEDENYLAPFLIDFDLMFSFQDLKKNKQILTSSMFKQQHQDDEHWVNYWSSPKCFTMHLGMRPKDWMNLDITLLKPDAISGFPAKLNLQPNIPQEIIPISEDLAEETTVLVYNLLRFIQMNLKVEDANFFSPENSEKRKKFSSKFNLEDQRLQKMYGYLIGVNEQMNDEWFTITANDFYLGLKDELGYSMDEHSYDEKLDKYLVSIRRILNVRKLVVVDDQVIEGKGENNDTHLLMV